MPAVLIVDDEAEICANLAAYLEDEGMQVHIAYSGEEAVRRIQEGLAVDVCIMDLRLPGIDGEQTVQAIQRLAPQVRYLIHTGSATYTLSPELRHLGVTKGQVFYKPLADMALLAEAAREVCGPL